MRRAELCTLISWMLGILLLATVAGCDRKPNHDMYGDIVNLREYRLTIWDPTNHDKNYEYMPATWRYFTLQGSTQYEFKAWIATDGTVTDDFVGRLNEIRKDVRLNDADIDWKWEAGGGFYACIKGIDPNDQASAQRIITLIALPNRPLPPPLVLVSAMEMQQLRMPTDAATHRRIAHDIMVRHHVPIPSTMQER